MSSPCRLESAHPSIPRTSSVGRVNVKSRRVPMYWEADGMPAFMLRLIVLVPLGLWIGSAPPSALWITSLMFSIQFVVCRLSARDSSRRFVCSVLSI